MRDTNPKSAASQVSPDTIQGDPEGLVIAALENPEFDWRTIDGLARETGLSVGMIEVILLGLGSKIIQSSIPDKQGRALFTTRAHYLAKQSIFNRLLSTASDTVK